jgi:hypothetical protein
METWDILQPLKAKCKINKEAIMCLNCLCIKKNGLENCCSRSPQFTVSSYRPDCHGSAEFAVADTEDLLTITEHVRLLKLSHQPAAPQSTISSSILSPSFTPRKSPGALFATPQSSTSAPPITPSSSGLSTSLLSPYPVVPYSVVPTLSSHEFQTPIQATNREITSLSSPVSEESLEKKFIYCVGEQYLDPDRRSFGRIEAIPIQNLDAYDLGENNSSRIKRAKNAHGKLELLLFNNSRISEHIKSRLAGASEPLKPQDDENDFLLIKVCMNVSRVGMDALNNLNPDDKKQISQITSLSRQVNATKGNSLPVLLTSDMDNKKTSNEYSNLLARIMKSMMVLRHPFGAYLKEALEECKHLNQQVEHASLFDIRRLTHRVFEVLRSLSVAKNTDVLYDALRPFVYKGGHSTDDEDADSMDEDGSERPEAGFTSIGSFRKVCTALLRAFKLVTAFLYYLRVELDRSSVNDDGTNAEHCFNRLNEVLHPFTEPGSTGSSALGLLIHQVNGISDVSPSVQNICTATTGTGGKRNIICGSHKITADDFLIAAQILSAQLSALFVFFFPNESAEILQKMFDPESRRFELRKSGDNCAAFVSNHDDVEHRAKVCAENDLEKFKFHLEKLRELLIAMIMLHCGFVMRAVDVSELQLATSRGNGNLFYCMESSNTPTLCYVGFLSKTQKAGFGLFPFWLGRLVVFFFQVLCKVAAQKISNALLVELQTYSQNDHHEEIRTTQARIRAMIHEELCENLGSTSDFSPETYKWMKFHPKRSSLRTFPCQPEDSIMFSLDGMGISAIVERVLCVQGLQISLNFAKLRHVLLCFKVGIMEYLKYRKANEPCSDLEVAEINSLISQVDTHQGMKSSIETFGTLGFHTEKTAELNYLAQIQLGRSQVMETSFKACLIQQSALNSFFRTKVKCTDEQGVVIRGSNESILDQLCPNAVDQEMHLLQALRDKLELPGSIVKDSIADIRGRFWMFCRW